MPRKQIVQWVVAGVIAGIVLLAQMWFAERQSRAPCPGQTPAGGEVRTPAAPSNVAPDRSPVARPNIGFRSRGALEEHLQKHGSEFGRITREEYLRRAQALRDAPAGGSIQETRRADGVFSRFDTRTGEFLAFNSDFTIRTFFKPNDGLAYFRRQATRSADEGDR